MNLAAGVVWINAVANGRRVSALFRSSHDSRVSLADGALAHPSCQLIE